MAKKVSRNSRAARQAAAFEPEAKSLANLPRNTKTDLSNVITRTAAKNEALLEAKIHKKGKKKVDKKKFKEHALDKLGNLDRNRVEKALNFSSRLDGKIAKSTSRAKYIQSIRKAGWDTTNELIKKEQALLQSESYPKKREENRDGIEGSGDEMETETPEDELVDPKPEQEKRINIFDMLPNDDEN
ncbi:related to Shuttling pre-60S factor ECM1 [Zygosaccharomyces bailii]|nr:related to Shuttling pre-60S factor ECM1 [Zygosaccharomyces bailii]